MGILVGIEQNLKHTVTNKLSSRLDSKISPIGFSHTSTIHLVGTVRKFWFQISLSLVVSFR